MAPESKSKSPQSPKNNIKFFDFVSNSGIECDMQSLNDDERREVLGEILADELQAIGEYVQDIPTIKRQVVQMHDKLDSLESRFGVFEHLVKTHDQQIIQLQNPIN